MQADHMPSNILSDQISIGGKSQLHRPKADVKDLIGENVATRSNHTEEQIPMRSNAAIAIYDTQIAPDNPTQAYRAEPTEVEQF